jgi:hypothetical protein
MGGKCGNDERRPTVLPDWIDLDNYNLCKKCFKDKF